MWIKGQATGHYDFLSQLAVILAGNHIDTVTLQNRGTGYAIDDTLGVVGGTNSSPIEVTVMGITNGNYVSAAVVNAGGTGYVVGDLLYIAGGTGSYGAECEVTSVAAGVVTGVQINKAGVYSVDPTTTANATTTDSVAGAGCTLDLTMTAGTGIIDSVHITSAGAYTVDPSAFVTTTTSGSGTGCTLDITMDGSNYVVDVNYRGREAVSAVVAAGGSGYAVNDILDVGGGTFTDGAQFQVSAVSGSAVTGVTVSVVGEYSTTPSNPLATSSTGGGSGCTLTVTWQDTLNQYLMVHNTVQSHYVGLKGSYESSTSAYYIEPAGYSGFNSLNTPWDEQPGYVLADSYTPAHDGAYNYWLSIKDRFIFMMTRIGTGTYPHLLVGLIDPTMTEDEYPYPQIVMGNTATPQPYTYGQSYYSGLPNPGTPSTSDLGPGWIRLPGGPAEAVYNWINSSGYQIYNTDAVSIQPGGQVYNDPAGDADSWYQSSSQDSWWSLVQVADTDSIYKDKLKRINGKYTLVPLMLSYRQGRQILGVIPGMFWFDNTEFTMQSEDRMVVGDDYYRVFQNVKKSNRSNMFIIKED